MLFNKNENRPNERILYKTKPNMILGCKKAIIGFILLVAVFFVSPTVIRFIGEMQVYLISHIKLSLTRYTAIAFFVVILVIVIYIIWQLVAWYSIEYTLTDSRIIIKSGVLSTKKNYMPYSTIQDVNTSQSIIAKLFNLGSVSVFSAYDNNQMVLSNILNPSEVEEIIFSHMVGSRSFQPQPPRIQQYYGSQYNDYEEDYFDRNDNYDEFEPITPLTHERFSNKRRDYEYYPDDFGFDETKNHTYEYEPFDNRYGGSYENSSRRFPQDEYYNEQTPNRGSRDNYYNEVRNNYSYSDEDYYNNIDSESYYNDGGNEFSQNDQRDVDDSPHTAIRRHFDKFKK